MTVAINWPGFWVLTLLAAFHVLVICAFGFVHWCQILTGCSAAFGLLWLRHAE
ncbi:hypothetical protein [Methylovirgula sp. 4M-Z18]|uniref:hypothetical protein n=1 Tax=Methylovirgula sp. 4M-Z18 TaxID=2293567 RepID=UPI001314D2A2|nr:hypothetical protein [Methylovirgula sp. 4M-Z18]